MKKKLSISIDETTINLLDGAVVDGRFRNKSHLIEFAITNFLNNRRFEN